MNATILFVGLISSIFLLLTTKRMMGRKTRTQRLERPEQKPPLLVRLRERMGNADWRRYGALLFAGKVAGSRFCLVRCTG